MLGMGSAKAFGDQKIDLPNPNVTPLVERNADIPSITDLAGDYRGPGFYPIELTSDLKVSVEIRWCSRTQDILTQNLQNIQFAFKVNEQDFLSRLHQFEEVEIDNNGEENFCHGYRGLISQWPSGKQVVYYSLTMNAPINDGWDDYPAGEIAWEYAISVLTVDDTLGDDSFASPRVTPLEQRSLDISHIRSLAKDWDGPGVYAAEIASQKEVRVTLGWCSKTAEILAANIEHLRFSLEINGQDMTDKYFKYDEIQNDYAGDGEAAFCYGYRGLLSDWPPGEHTIRNTLYVDEVLNDGWVENPAGEFVWEYVVLVGEPVEASGAGHTVSVSLNTNCRKGPGQAYEIIGELREGETAEVVGRHPESTYWVIIEPRFGRQCWLWGEYADVTGDVSSLKVFTPPPLPTATPTPTPDPEWIESICLCNSTGDHISSFKLFNDDTDEWLGELGADGFASGYCNCFSAGGPYPPGDYAVEYKVCADGEACTEYGDTHIQPFEVHTDGQHIEINP